MADDRTMAPYYIQWSVTDDGRIVVCELCSCDAGDGESQVILTASRTMLDADPEGMRLYDDVVAAVDGWMKRLLVKFGAEDVEIVEASRDGFEA